HRSSPHASSGSPKHPRIMGRRNRENLIGDQTIQLLLIENDAGDVRLLKELLSEMEFPRFNVTTADTLARGLAILKQNDMDIILSDLSLPDSTGLETFDRLQKEASHVPIVVMIGLNNEPLGLQAVKRGAQDSLLKGELNADLIGRAMRYAIERHRAEEALKESEEFPANIIDSSLDMIIAVDNRRRITEFNKAAQETFGYEREEVLGKHVNILYARPDEGLKVHKTAVQMGRDVEVVHNRRKNGEVFPCLLSASLLFNSRGERVGVMGVSRDITEQKKAEEALRLAKERAEASDRLKNVFLSTISHELRTPLNVIVGYAGLLVDELGDSVSTEVKEMAETIRDSSGTLKRLIDDILDVSLIEAQRLVLHSESLPADDLAMRCVNEILVEAERKGLEVVTDLAAPRARLLVDKVRFRQAFGNILQNAVKYTRQGNIAVRSRIENGEYVVTVTDTGIGIKETFMPHLFSIFRQEDEGYGREFEGVGLGLAISQRLVSAMGGRIEVKSAKGKGTTFTLTFPVESRKQRGEREKEAVATREAQGPKKKKGQKGKILILEDNPPNLKYMEFLLKRLGLDFMSATTAEEALSKLKDQSVSLMLIDVSLAEGMSGIDFLHTVNKEEKHQNVPKVAVTAHAMKGQKEEYLREGFDDYLAKPFTLDELKQILSKHG
ncbi:MAG: response regulator, partial [Fidelibacterota bacterium]